MCVCMYGVTHGGGGCLRGSGAFSHSHGSGTLKPRHRGVGGSLRAPHQKVHGVHDDDVRQWAHLNKKKTSLRNPHTHRQQASSSRSLHIKVSQTERTSYACLWHPHVGRVHVLRILSGHSSETSQVPGARAPNDGTHAHCGPAARLAGAIPVRKRCGLDERANSMTETSARLMCECVCVCCVQ